MAVYWSMIPHKPPPNDNIRTYGAGSYERSKNQHDEMSQQWISMKKMTLNIHSMSEKLQCYMEDNQIQCKKEHLKYEEFLNLNKERLKHEKEHLGDAKECKKE